MHARKTQDVIACLNRNLVGEGLDQKARPRKFWIFLLLGSVIFMPFFVVFGLFEMHLAFVVFFVGFLIYCYGLYRLIQKKAEPKYPLVPPEGRMTDYYFPRSKIPRPIHEDVRRYPEFFKRKKMKRWEKNRRKSKKKS